MSSLLASDDSLPYDNDGQLYKTQHCHFTKDILIKGCGFSKPLLESQCDIGCAEADDVLDYDSISTQDKLSVKKSVTIGMSKDTHCLGLETMVMTMKKGETSCFQVSWKQCSPIVDSPEKRKRWQYIILVLNNFSDATPIWQLNSEQKYDRSLQHKDNGTLLFKDDSVESAFIRYSLALKYIISVTNTAELDESLKEKYRKLRCVCYLNMAACQIKSENFESVVENCTKVLAMDPWNAKGLYRRALAYKHLGQLDDARSDLIKIVKKEPRNKTAGDLLESLMPSNAEKDCIDSS